MRDLRRVLRIAGRRDPETGTRPLRSPYDPDPEEGEPPWYKATSVIVLGAIILILVIAIGVALAAGAGDGDDDETSEPCAQGSA